MADAVKTEQDSADEVHTEPERSRLAARGPEPVEGWLESIRLWLPVAAYALAIFVVSSLPSIPEPPGLGGIDKPEHYIAYAGLSVLVFRAIRRTWAGLGLRAVVFAAVAISAAYGATDELHQHFVSTRYCDFTDWIADLLGAVTGAALVRLLADFRVRPK